MSWGKVVINNAFYVFPSTGVKTFPQVELNCHYRRIKDMHLAYLGENIPENFTKRSDVNGINIALKIIDDQYDFLYDKYKQLARTNKFINGYTGWKDIYLPEYYVTKVSGCNNFVVYRYEK